MAMRNTSFGSSKYGEAMSKLGDKIEKKAAKANPMKYKPVSKLAPKTSPRPKPRPKSGY
jgi:hypothetical protein